MHTLFKNATIIDGTANAPQKGCVLVENDRIADVLFTDVPRFEGEIVDCDGLTLAPGFIDAHSHNDFFATRDNADFYFKPFALQGITTMVCGNCGFSLAGFEKDTPHKRDIGAGLFRTEGEVDRFNTFGQYFDLVDKYSPLNICALAGHGTAHISIAGLGEHKLDATGKKRLEAVLCQALDEGAAGVSLGLMYDPGMFCDYDELKVAALAAKKYGRPVTVHTRANSAVSTSYPELLGRAHNLRALDEIVRLARETGVAMHNSHLIFVGTRSHKTVDEYLGIIKKCIDDGIDFSFDLYPYDFGASVITVVLPTWYKALSAEQKRSAFTRFKLSALVFGAKKLLGFGFNDIMITYIGEGFEKYEGRRVSEIARESKTSDFTAYLDLVEKSLGRGSVLMYRYCTPEITSRLAKHPLSVFMTDAWLETYGVQNPAAYSSFPCFLRMSREGNGPDLVTTVRKMTGQTADRFKIPMRGYIKKGYYADITLFNADTVSDTPELVNRGVERVYINGKLAVKNGEYYSGVLAGKSARIF